MKINNLSKALGFLSFSFFFSCHEKNEVIKEYWPNHKIKTSYLYTSNDTNNYVKMEFFENGDTKSEIHILNNFIHGESKCWFPNKQIMYDEFYMHGNLKKFTSWYDDGTQSGMGDIIALDTLTEVSDTISSNTIRQFGNITYWKQNGEKEFDMKVIDTTGAGDGFNAGLAVALSEGKNILEALVFANAVGGLSVTKSDTIPSYHLREQVDAFLLEATQNVRAK